jgi:hypothetical protein
MKKWCLISAIALLVVGTSLVMANKDNQGDGDGFNITITPKTLSFKSADTVVSVHSNIPYGLVDTVSLQLNGIPAVFSKADTCGDLVVKFDRDDVKDIVQPPSATLTLSGALKDGSCFEVSDIITVKK